MTTITLYRVTASYEHDGQLLDASSSAEVLGDAYGRHYATEAEAEAVAEDMQSDLASYDLDPSTTYSVVEAPVSIRVTEQESGEDGTVTVSALVNGYETAWFAHTDASGQLEPCGDSLEQWADADILDRLYGDAAANAIGREVLALAAAEPAFLGHMGSVKVGPGDVVADVAAARELRGSAAVAEHPACPPDRDYACSICDL